MRGSPLYRQEAGGESPSPISEPGAVLRRPFDGLYALRLYYLYMGAQNAVEKIETEGVL